MTRSRGVSLVSAVLVGASLSLAPITGHAGPGPSEPSNSAAPVEGPARPPSDAPEAQPNPPPPTFDPDDSPGIEFVVPPPESEDDPRDPEPESPLAATFPDPGVAPNDGNSILVLSGTTVGLTMAGFSAGLAIGLENQIPLEWLLPSTIVPTAGLLAFGVGGLVLGIKRARAHHRWELAYRVVGEPQGAGLQVGGTFLLLSALAFIPSGAFELERGNAAFGASMIAVGSLSLVSMPIMFAIGARRARHYARTGGWHRRPIPQVPGQSGVRLRITPLVAPTVGGVMIGAAGRF